MCEGDVCVCAEGICACVSLCVCVCVCVCWECVFVWRGGVCVYIIDKYS